MPCAESGRPDRRRGIGALATAVIAALVICCGGARTTGSGATAAAGSTSNNGVEAPPLPARFKVHIAGDSTAAIFPPTDATARVGWAAVFQPFFTDGVEVNDAARSGRSSKSFIDEGLWKALTAQIHPGDWVFIQFGHNDEKMADSSRYTDPRTSFREYLRIYIRDTRAAGARPVLLTPISRREFSGASIVSTHGAYPAAVIAVGEETGTPVIDMTEKTRVMLESLGPSATIPLFAADDKTHLSAQGAPRVANLVAEGIRELHLSLAERLVP